MEIELNTSETNYIENYERSLVVQKIQGTYLVLIEKIISRIQDLMKEHEQESIKTHIHRWQKQESKLPKPTNIFLR